MVYGEKVGDLHLKHTLDSNIKGAYSEIWEVIQMKLLVTSVGKITAMIDTVS